MTILYCKLQFNGCYDYMSNIAYDIICEIYKQKYDRE